jgi:hypothetical protein
LRFHVWYPGCPMEDDAYGIPKPKGTEAFDPQLLLVPCVGFRPRGLRLGYGGGFYDRTLAALQPRPVTVGVGYSNGFVPWLDARAARRAAGRDADRRRAALAAARALGPAGRVPGALSARGRTACARHARMPGIRSACRSPR